MEETKDLKAINPAAALDLLQLIKDLYTLVESPGGQAVLADIMKLVSDFLSKK